MFDPAWRDAALAALDEPFDLVILGGGITGCGVLLDAAQRGLRALLVERHDVASGTSSRSSKLIHGGLRYLRNRQLRLTRQSCRERDRMLALSPHLVEPLDFVYPAYRDERPPGWQVELGLRLYDRLTTSPGRRHARLDEAEMARLAPGLPAAGLGRALRYGDARADDARLTLAVAATACAYGGYLLTRARVEEGIRDPGGRVRGLVLRDEESGRSHRLEAALTVNATGVWVDEVRHLLGLEGRYLRPLRGSHLIFDHRRLPLAAAVARPSPDDGRPVFFVPHPEGVLAGTTDRVHRGPLDDPRPAPQEVDYLLRAAAHAFPGQKPHRADVRGAFAGLRPVVDDGIREPSRASREEKVWHERGLLSVAGGKLTTWRAMAEEVVDAALELLPPERRRRARPCATAGTPLAGLAPPDLAGRLAARHRLAPAVAAAMARRLGSLAWTACELAADERELRPLAEDLDLCAAEVRAHLRYGAARRLDDLLLRRVRIGLWQPARAAELAPALRPLLDAELGWDDDRYDAECEHLNGALGGWQPPAADAGADGAPAADDPRRGDAIPD